MQLHASAAFIAAVALALAPGCSPSDHQLVVQIVTDMTPLVEFDEIHVEVPAGTAPETVLARAGAGYGRGVRVLSREVAEGSVLVRVVLFHQGTEVARAERRRRVSGRATILTVRIDRACIGVVCSDALASACLGGVCVPDDCTPETPESCPPGECGPTAGGVACVPSAIACADATCSPEGSCLDDPHDERCSAGEVCDALRGCLRIPPQQPDGGVDGAALDAGSPASSVFAVGSSGDDVAWDVALDDAGNVYVVWSYGGSIDLGGAIGTIVAPGIQDALVASWDLADAPRWAWTPGMTGRGDARDIVLTAGGLVVAGLVSGDATRGGVSITGAAPQDALVLRLTTVGAAIDAGHYGGSRNVQARGLGASADGTRIAVSGLYADTVDFGGGALPDPGSVDAGFIALLDDSGAEIWARALPGDGDNTTANDAAVAADGSVCVVMSFTGTGDLGGGALTSMGARNDAVVVRYDEAGAWQWQRVVATDANDDFVSVVAAPDGDCVVAGWTRGLPAIEDAPPLSFAGGTDALAARFDAADGSVIWARQFGGPGEDESSDIAIDEAGIVYVLARWQGTAILPDGEHTTTSGGAAVVFAVLADGTVPWVRVIDPEGPFDASASGLGVSPSGRHLAVTATFQGAITVDGVMLEAAGLNDGLVYRFTPP